MVWSIIRNMIDLGIIGRFFNWWIEGDLCDWGYSGDIFVIVHHNVNKAIARVINFNREFILVKYNYLVNGPNGFDWLLLIRLSRFNHPLLENL